MRRMAPLLILPCVLLAAGCGDPPLPKREQATTKTLIEHDFDDPHSKAWIDAPGGKVVDGAFVMTARPGELARSGAATDIRVEDVQVTARASSDDIHGDDATFGVLCRWKFDAAGGSRDYYAFTIAPNGYAAIGTSRSFLWQSTRSVPAIKRGTGTVNELRAECVGTRLSLYVNDTLVHTVHDKKLSSGDVGITLENYGKRRRATARFDDFVAAQVF